MTARRDGAESLPAPVAQAAVIDVLVAEGMSSAHARIVAEVMIAAEVAGHASHGLILLPVYVERLRKGGIRTDTEPVWNHIGAGVGVVEARGVAGQVSATLAAERCAILAKALGVSTVGVRQGNHIGMLTAYSAPFQREQVIGLILNLAGASVAPPSGDKPSLGNNAMCMVVPTSRAEAFAIDFATGAVACGKIRHAAARGAGVPPGWVLDASGASSCNPDVLDQGGSVPIFGGYKGLALSLLIEILAGLPGGIVSTEVHRQRTDPGTVMNTSQLFIGIDPQRFSTEPQDSRVARLEAAVRLGYSGAPPWPYFPGQRESQATALVAGEGVWIPPAVRPLLNK